MSFIINISLCSVLVSFILLSLKIHIVLAVNLLICSTRGIGYTPLKEKKENKGVTSRML